MRYFGIVSETDRIFLIGWKMADKVEFENRHFWNFKSHVTLTPTLDDLESHIVVNVSLTLTKTTIWFVAALCFILDVRTDGRTFLPGLLGHLSENAILTAWNVLYVAQQISFWTTATGYFYLLDALKVTQPTLSKDRKKHEVWLYHRKLLLVPSLLQSTHLSMRAVNIPLCHLSSSASTFNPQIQPLWLTMFAL